jgi:hypothetical protein
MNTARKWTLSVAVAIAAVAVAGPAATARADDAGVKTAIKHQDRTLSQSSQVKTLSNMSKIKKSEIPKLEKLVKAVVPKLTHAASSVSSATASTAKGAAGQKAWVNGVRDVATGYRHVARELTDLRNANSTGAKTQLNDARKAITAGERLVLTADSDLGLPQGD